MKTNRIFSILAVLLMALTAQAQSTVLTWENISTTRLTLSNGQLTGGTNYSQGDVTLSARGMDETHGTVDLKPNNKNKLNLQIYNADMIIESAGAAIVKVEFGCESFSGPVLNSDEWTWNSETKKFVWTGKSYFITLSSRNLNSSTYDPLEALWLNDITSLTITFSDDDSSIPTSVLEWENLSETRLSTTPGEGSTKTNCSQGGVSIDGWRGTGGQAGIFVFDNMLCLNVMEGGVTFSSSPEKILKIEIVCTNYSPNGFTSDKWSWDANTKTLTWTGKSDNVSLTSLGENIMVDGITSLTFTLTHTIHTYGQTGTSRYTCSECGHVNVQAMKTVCDINGDGVIDASDITEIVNAILKQ